MKPRILLLAAAFALFGCKSSVSWHQKLTIVVETPAGEARGASVTRIEKVSNKGSLVLPEARGTRSYSFGEAVVVEVMPGK
jgi:hypothetical protein